MTDYQSIAIELNAIYKDKALSKMLGVTPHILTSLRTGRTLRPRNPEHCTALKDFHQKAKESGWI